MSGAGKLWVAFIDDLYEPFDRDVHCVTDAAMIGFEMEDAEGTTGAACSFIRRQTGWQILGTDQPKAVIVSESATGNPADAFVRVRALVGEIPSDLFSPRQTLTMKAAPLDIDQKILDFGKANPGPRGTTDLLFSDADPESAETYLLGRSATYYVDPATHAVRYNDILDGDRVVDMRDKASWKNSPPTDGPPDEGGPVKRIRARLNTAFTQRAVGTCNITGFLGVMGSFNDDFGEKGLDVPGGLLTVVSSPGWHLVPGGARYRMARYTSAAALSGRRQRYTYKIKEAMYSNWGSFAGYFEYFTTRIIHEFVGYYYWIFRFYQVLMGYDYTQERSEIGHFSLEIPVQGSAVVSEEADIIELTLGDLHDDPTAPFHDPTILYRKGDRVTFGGRSYEALRDIEQPQQFSAQLPGLGIPMSLHPYWKSAVRAAPLVDTRRVSFLDSDRGLLVAEHVFLRMRKEARQRLRGRTVTLTYRWEDARDVRMTDEIMFDVPFGDGIISVTGKVTSIHRQWPSSGQPTVKITVAVPFGDGTNEAAASSTTAYADDYADDYTTGGGPLQAAGDDVAWTYVADELSNPINTFYLSDPTYAVLAAERINMAETQATAMAVYAHKGLHPQMAVMDRATRVKVMMRPLVTEGIVTREYDFEGELLVAKRGVDLMIGGGA